MQTADHIIAEQPDVPWMPQAGPQHEAIKKHWVPELFFGGAKGGGKSDFMLGDFGQDVPVLGAHWHGIIFRKSYPQLEELVKRALMIYPNWFGLEAKDCWRSGSHTFHWPNGATLKFRHMENDDSWLEYQGHQYGWVGFDELPQWSNNVPYMQMKSTLRNATIPIPNKRIRSTGNPGGPGHGWVKQHFAIDRYPLGGELIVPAVKGGTARMFIKSKVTDNKILMKNDPEYVHRLADLGSPTLVKQYLDGDWNVIAGAYFPEFSIDKHVLRPFAVPSHWMRFRSMDWGSASPFSVGWYAVSDGNPVSRDDGTVVELPRGALVKYREWYGVKISELTGLYEPNVGLKMTAEEVAKGILKREAETMQMSVLDPSAFKEDGGPSIASRMGNLKVYFQKADNSRKVGWDAMRSRLKGTGGVVEVNNGVGTPMIYFFTNCDHTIRTIPELQHDTGKAAGAIEDVETESEDHAGDETRYACMARPWIGKKPVEPEAVKYTGAIHANMTFNDIVEQRRRRRLASGE